MKISQFFTTLSKQFLEEQNLISKGLERADRELKQSPKSTQQAVEPQVIKAPQLKVKPKGMSL